MIVQCSKCGDYTRRAKDDGKATCFNCKQRYMREYSKERLLKKQKNVKSSA